MPRRSSYPATGIDVVDRARLERSLARGGEAFRRRVFTPAETERGGRSRDPMGHFAAIFAAKEACFKAIGLPYDAGFEWQDLDVDPGSCRRPARVVCRGAIARALGDSILLLTVGAGRDEAIALAMRVPAASHRPPAC